MTTIGRLGGPERGVAVGYGQGVRAQGAHFAVPEAPAPAAGAGSVEAAQPLSLIGAMVALQEAELRATRDRAARKHGETMLEELRALQVRLLGGGVERGLLGRLAMLAKELPQAADPKLAALVRAVALRAEVELAREAIGAECGAAGVA